MSGLMNLEDLARGPMGRASKISEWGQTNSSYRPEQTLRPDEIPCQRMRCNWPVAPSPSFQNKPANCSHLSGLQIERSRLTTVNLGICGMLERYGL